MTLVGAEECAMGADTTLTARKANQLIRAPVLSANSIRQLHLLLLFLLYLHLGLGEAVLEV
jgi:hypothetical protein